MGLASVLLPLRRYVRFSSGYRVDCEHLRSLQAVKNNLVKRFLFLHIFTPQDKRFFAVGCIGEMPNVYIYRYPSFELVRVLQKGTEKGVL